MEIIKLTSLMAEWGPVGILAGMLFFLIREQSRQHKENINKLSNTHLTTTNKLTETILIQSELIDEVKSIAKITRKEAFEHRRKFEEYSIASSAQHGKLEAVVDIIQENTSRTK
tara:strand:+ start:569 stop:910 length:342 start_codon:yes stop_codon:yes gene_type:complete